MSTGKIGVSTGNLFPIIKKFLYSDHDIFLREIVSNAVDATQKLKILASSGKYKGNIDQLKVRISVDKEAKTITVSDNGIGMTAEEVEKYINQIAFSGANEFLEKYKNDANAIIGHFGLGFYSSFMVSEEVEIVSVFCLKLLFRKAAAIFSINGNISTCSKLGTMAACSALATNKIRSTVFSNLELCS